VLFATLLMMMMLAMIIYVTIVVVVVGRRNIDRECRNSEVVEADFARENNCMT
jgi:hypothetical protein